MVIPAGVVVLAAVSSRKSVGAAVAPAALVVEVVVPMIVVAHERRRWCKKHWSGLNSASWFSWTELKTPPGWAAWPCARCNVAAMAVRIAVVVVIIVLSVGGVEVGKYCLS